MNALKGVLSKVLGTATAILFAVMVVSVVWQVFSREITGNPAAWTDELARYVFVWTALVGAALVFLERGHIAVTFVVDLLPKTMRRVIAVLIQLVILFFAVMILVVGGLGAVDNTWQQQLTALPGTIGQAYLVMPVVGVLIALIAVIHLIEDLRGEGPLTTDAAQTEVAVPDVAGLETAEAELLTEEESPSGATNRDTTDTGSDATSSDTSDPADPADPSDPLDPSDPTEPKEK